jgi:hypothetical protein
VLAGGNPASDRVVVSAMETPPRWRQTAAVGLSSTILAGFVAFGLLVVVELFPAEHSADRNPLPPPGDRALLLAVLGVAVVSGVLIALQWRRNPHRYRSVRGLSAVTAIATAVAVVATLVTHFALQQSYLDTVPAGIASRSDLLDAGHQACDWLEARHWGAPPDISILRPHRGPQFSPLESAALQAIHGRGYPTMVVISSTLRLFQLYSRYLDSQSPGPLTQADRIRLKVAFVAWYKMCPFQQWVHRPVGDGD